MSSRQRGRPVRHDVSRRPGGLHATVIPAAAVERLEAWNRARAAESLRARWDRCGQLLERAVDAGLERASVAAFAEELAALTAGVVELEPILEAAHLDVLIAIYLGHELGVRRGEEDVHEGLVAALVEVEEEMAE